MKETIKKEIEKYKAINEKALKAYIPCWQEIDHNRGYIDGLRFALELIAKHDVLDKIRAEIEQTAKDYDKFDDYRRVRGLRIALEIIDKYKAESEE